MISACIENAARRLRLHDVELAIKRCSLIVIIATFIFVAINLFTRSAYLNSYFIPDWQDSFMDFFNTMESVRMGDPYYADANYPPLVFLLFKVLYHIVIPGDISNLPNPRGEAFEMRSYMPSMLMMLLMYLECSLIIALCIRKMMRGQCSGAIDLFVVSVFVSGPFVFLLERGNVLLITFSLVMLFFTFQDSEKRWQRVLGCMSLAAAASMKLYPAIFAILLLKEKRYRSFWLTVVLGVALFVLPFFFFEGVSSISAFFNGLLKSSSEQGARGFGLNYSFYNLISLIMGMIGVRVELPASFLSLVALLISLVVFLCAESHWQKVFACSLACVWVPSFSYTYTLVMFVPVFIVMAAQGELDKRSLPVLILLTVTQVMLPSSVVWFDNSGYLYSLHWMCFLGNMAILIATIICLRASISSFVTHRLGEMAR